MVEQYLLDDVNGVVYLLPLQKGVQVVHKVEEVSFSATMRNEDRYALPRYAVWGIILAFSHSFVFFLHIRQF